MSKDEWEYDLVERPFCEQFKAMGWRRIEGRKDVPEFPERAAQISVICRLRFTAKRQFATLGIITETTT